MHAVYSKMLELVYNYYTTRLILQTAYSLAGKLTMYVVSSRLQTPSGKGLRLVYTEHFWGLFLSSDVPIRFRCHVVYM